MGIVGDLGRYTQFQVAQSIPRAAEQGGGAAGAGVGVGAGIAMGQAMAQVVGATKPAEHAPREASVAPPSSAAPMAGAATPAGAATVICGRCQARLDRTSKFCPDCGASLA
jgi:membrane protease subunit (stomatin/prohibitin family)